jgi:hypothetical protein
MRSFFYKKRNKPLTVIRAVLTVHNSGFQKIKEQLGSRHITMDLKNRKNQIFGFIIADSFQVLP